MRISDWSSDVCSSDLLGEDWAASLDFTWSRSSIDYLLRPGPFDTAALLASGFNPLIDHYNLGTFDLRPYALGEINTIGVPVPSSSYNPTLRFSGPLSQMPAGAATVSFLIEQQNTRSRQGARWPTTGRTSGWTRWGQYV